MQTEGQLKSITTVKDEALSTIPYDVMSNSDIIFCAHFQIYELKIPPEPHGPDGPAQGPCLGDSGPL